MALLDLDEALRDEAGEFARCAPVVDVDGLFHLRAEDIKLLACSITLVCLLGGNLARVAIQESHDWPLLVDRVVELPFGVAEIRLLIDGAVTTAHNEKV